MSENLGRDWFETWQPQEWRCQCRWDWWARRLPSLKTRGKKELWNLERRFGCLDWLIGSTCVEGYSPLLKWWRVALSRFCRVSSYRGLTIETASQRMSVEDGISLHLRHAHRVYSLHWCYIVSIERFVRIWFREKLHFVFSPLYSTFAQVVFLCIREVIISSENNNFGNCSSQTVRIEIQWIQLQCGSPLPCTTRKFSSSPVSRTRPPAKGVAMHEVMLGSCVFIKPTSR